MLLLHTINGFSLSVNCAVQITICTISVSKASMYCACINLLIEQASINHKAKQRVLLMDYYTCARWTCQEQKLSFCMDRTF